MGASHIPLPNSGNLAEKTHRLAHFESLMFAVFAYVGTDPLEIR